MDVFIHEFNISQALPNVSTEQLLKVKEKLEEIGVVEFQDLKEVREEDLCGLLKPIQARKLIKLWKSESHEKEILTPSLDSSPLETYCLPSISNATSMPSTSTCVPNIQPPVPVSSNLNARWADTFELDYKVAPKELMRALLKKERPKPTLRRSFVRLAASQIQRVCKRPLKKDLTIIAEKIIQKCPCLADKFFDEDIGSGHESLLRSLIYRCENTNRVDKDLDQPPKQKNSKGLDESSSSTKRKLCYGTVNSHPDIPSDIAESLEEKKKKLKNMYFENHKNCEKEEIMQLLRDTYSLQRSDLNAKMEVALLMLEWPFLFEKEGMFVHFHHLVGFEINKIFESNFHKKSRRVMDFIGGENSNPDDAKEITLLEFLEGVSRSFKEDLSFLIIEGDSEISKREAEMLENLPKTPCIIACGNKREAKNFMLSVDGIVINESCCTLMDSFLMLLATYYIFNIAYPEEACATLEFVQRCYLGINPDRGSKRQKMNGKSKVHPKLLAFLDKMSNFEWL